VSGVGGAYQILLIGAVGRCSDILLPMCGDARIWLDPAGGARTNAGSSLLEYPCLLLLLW
jgi:hypothetical protein